MRAMAHDRLGSAFAVAVDSLEACSNAALFPVEISAMAGAAPRRWATFRAGRACARAALLELGMRPFAIPVDGKGAPVWPADFAGSISHTDTVAAAVVSRNPTVLGLGLDLEKDEPLDDEGMVRLICRPEELLAGGDPAHSDNLEHGKLLFVLKESVYKACRAIDDRFLDFQDVRVAVDRRAGAFCTTFAGAEIRDRMGNRAVHGNFTRAEGFLAAIASLDSEFGTVRY
jgi:4'-phosphopantetheinyl transferase EntD